MGIRLHLIVYLSEAIIPEGQVDQVLDDIVKLSKRQNRAHHITGVLFYIQGRFMQVIEGKEEDLRQLMSNIEKDKRHKDVHYLVDEPVITRGFRKWNMDAFKLGGDKSFDLETLRELTNAFKKDLIPRSDMLVVYYKALLKEKRVQAYRLKVPRKVKRT